MASDSFGIEMPIWLWIGLVLDLRRRGRSIRESGAFLLGTVHGPRARVRRYMCYDDIDAQAYQHGAIAFHASGYAALWQVCKACKLEVVADVHTHPGANVMQSQIDQRHPMLPVVGHTALILPHFGRTGFWSLAGVGVYEYLGAFKWRSCAGANPPRIRLMLW